MNAHRILQINALSTSVSASAMLAARGGLYPLFGLGSPLLLDVVAVAFLVYAAALVVAARQRPVDPRALIVFSIADGAWVVASAIALVLFWAQLHPFGRVLIIAVALVVEVFATLQYRAAGVLRSRTPRAA
jgi:hypothetical protein